MKKHMFVIVGLLAVALFAFGNVYAADDAKPASDSAKTSCTDGAKCAAGCTKPCCAKDAAATCGANCPKKDECAKAGKCQCENCPDKAKCACAKAGSSEAEAKDAKTAGCCPKKAEAKACEKSGSCPAK